MVRKNPIAQVNYTTDFTDSYKANFFQFFEIKFNKYLKFRANINANFYLDKRKKLEPSLITDEWQKQNKGYSYNYLNWNWMNEDFITYARKIKGHNFSAMVGVSAQQWRYENENFCGIEFLYRLYLYNERVCCQSGFILYGIYIEQSLHGFRFCTCDV